MFRKIVTIPRTVFLIVFVSHAFVRALSAQELPSRQSLDFFDATKVHPRAKGFQCADFDPIGRRILFYPWGGYLKNPGSVFLAYQVDKDFLSAASYEAVDLKKLISQDAQGFGAGFVDEKEGWCYLVPFRKQRGAVMEANDLAIRFDLRKELSDRSAYETFRLSSLKNSIPRMGWITGAAVNGYAYFMPYGESLGQAPWFRRHGYLLRYNVKKAFGDPAAWEWVDLKAQVDSRAFGFQSCAVKGPWLYLIPYDENVLIRYDTRKPFSAASSYEKVDLKKIHTRAVGYTGGLVVGDFLVLVPYRDLKKENIFTQSVNFAAMFDTGKSLDDKTAWSFVDLGQVDSEAKGGYQFGWVDHQDFVHLAPTFNFKTFRPPAFVVWNSRLPFSDPASWAAYPSGGLVTSTGAAYDGRNAYLAPWGRNGQGGRITRVISE